MKSTENEIEKAQMIIKSFQKEIRYNIIQILYIYPQLTTKQIGDYLGVSKQTVLRHVEELVEVGMIDKEEISNRQHLYKLNKENQVAVRGQNLREKVINDREVLKAYNAYRLAIITGINNITQQMVAYQKEMNSFVDKADDSDLLSLMQDHLGQISTTYYTAKKYAETIGLDTEGLDNEIKEYMKMELVLPIRRVLDVTRNGYTPDGTLWFYDRR